MAESYNIQAYKSTINFFAISISLSFNLLTRLKQIIKGASVRKVYLLAKTSGTAITRTLFYSPSPDSWNLLFHILNTTRIQHSHFRAIFQSLTFFIHVVRSFTNKIQKERIALSGDGMEGAGSSVGRRPVNDCGLRTSSFSQTNLLSFLRPDTTSYLYFYSCWTRAYLYLLRKVGRLLMEIVFPPRETLLRLVATSIDHQSCVVRSPDCRYFYNAIEIVTIADPAAERPN